MSIKRASTSTALNGFPKYPSMWDQSTQAATYDYIGSINIGAETNNGTIAFWNIPQTYTHLQIRGLARSTRTYSGNAIDEVRVYLNGAIYGSNNLNLQGDGTTFSTNAAGAFIIDDGGGPTGMYSPFIIDIFDYTSTSATKTKTTRITSGADTNSSSPQGFATFATAYYSLNSTVTGVGIYLAYGGVWKQYSTVAIYGIK